MHLNNGTRVAGKRDMFNREIAPVTSTYVLGLFQVMTAIHNILTVTFGRDMQERWKHFWYV